MRYNLSKIILLFAASILFAGCQQSTMESQFTRLETPKEQDADKAQYQAPEIAIVAHLTGERAARGWEYGYLIKSGLSSATPAPINTTIYDGSNPESWRQIGAKKTNMIIAATGSQISRALAARALKRDMVMLSLSNDSTISRDNILLLGHRPMAQFNLLTEWLIVNDYKQIFALLPAGKYSSEMQKKLQEKYIANNATLVRSSFYLNDEKSIDDAVKIIMDNIDVMYERGKKPKRPPVIYVSDAPANLENILSKLASYNMADKFIVAGDSRIDVASAKSLNVIFTGSKLHSKREIFNKILEKSYDDIDLAHLNYMHLICYDMGRIAAMGILKDSFSAKNFLSSLDDKIYAGLSGDIIFGSAPPERGYGIIFYDADGIYKNLPE